MNFCYNCSIDFGGDFMYTNFNIDFNNFNKKENAIKFMLMGVLLIILGLLCLTFKTLGIKLISWTFGIALLFFAYLNLKNINELKRYATKEEIKPSINIQWVLIIACILLFVFPQKIQSIFSLFLGFYLIFNQLVALVNSKNNPYSKFTTWNIIKILFGICLILSPLFLSRFIVSIMSFFIILFGLVLFFSGNTARKY
ncbi:TPA: DUF308 domain-containing protein [Clostridioides difficile]|nr:DUF308 domain-containing protein [Clostridioides difficile]HBG4017270.1 DUF308 domain-containing protein [Clostridioides difficile]